MTEILDTILVQQQVEDGLEHGRPSTYNNHKCRCEKCRTAWATYIREKGYVRAYQQRKREEKLNRQEAKN